MVGTFDIAVVFVVVDGILEVVESGVYLFGLSVGLSRVATLW